jgi:hypothetical protein
MEPAFVPHRQSAVGGDKLSSPSGFHTTKYSTTSLFSQVRTLNDGSENVDHLVTEPLRVDTCSGSRPMRSNSLLAGVFLSQLYLNGWTPIFRS